MSPAQPRAQSEADRPVFELDLGPLTSDNDMARERTALIWAYCGAWAFGMVVVVVYELLFHQFDRNTVFTLCLLAIGLAYAPVVFKPSVNRAFTLVPVVLIGPVLLMAGLAFEQPGVNNFLLVPLVFSAFFLWRNRWHFGFAWAYLVVAYCALPLLIGGAGELRRVLIGGPIFVLVGGLTFLLVRRAGRLQVERSTFQSTVSSLLTALNSRDGVRREQALRTVEVAEEVALELGLSEADREQVRFAAYLHDIGKLGVPTELIDKRGPLSSEEWEQLRQHPITGERIVRSVPGFDDIAVIVRHEHEHWNGGGFPDGLSGDRIPIESRILLACYAFTELSSDHDGGTLDEPAHARAANDIQVRSGTQFDPEVVDALLTVAVRRGNIRADRLIHLSLRLAG